MPRCTRLRVYSTPPNPGIPLINLPRCGFQAKLSPFTKQIINNVRGKAPSAMKNLEVRSENEIVSAMNMKLCLAASDGQ